MPGPKPPRSPTKTAARPTVSTLAHTAVQGGDDSSPLPHVDSLDLLPHASSRRAPPVTTRACPTALVIAADVAVVGTPSAGLAAGSPSTRPPLSPARPARTHSSDGAAAGRPSPLGSEASAGAGGSSTPPLLHVDSLDLLPRRGLGSPVISAARGSPLGTSTLNRHSPLGVVPRALPRVSSGAMRLAPLAGPAVRALGASGGLEAGVGEADGEGAVLAGRVMPRHSTTTAASMDGGGGSPIMVSSLAGSPTAAPRTRPKSPGGTASPTSPTAPQSHSPLTREARADTVAPPRAAARGTAPWNESGSSAGAAPRQAGLAGTASPERQMSSPTRATLAVAMATLKAPGHEGSAAALDLLYYQLEAFAAGLNNLDIVLVGATERSLPRLRSSFGDTLAFSRLAAAQYRECVSHALELSSLISTRPAGEDECAPQPRVSLKAAAARCLDDAVGHGSAEGDAIAELLRTATPEIDLIGTRLEQWIAGRRVWVTGAASMLLPALVGVALDDHLRQAVARSLQLSAVASGARSSDEILLADSPHHRSFCSWQVHWILRRLGRAQTALFMQATRQVLPPRMYAECVRSVKVALGEARCEFLADQGLLDGGTAAVALAATGDGAATDADAAGTRHGDDSGGTGDRLDADGSDSEADEATPAALGVPRHSGASSATRQSSSSRLTQSSATVSHASAPGGSGGAKIATRLSSFSAGGTGPDDDSDAGAMEVGEAEADAGAAASMPVRLGSLSDQPVRKPQSSPASVSPSGSKRGSLSASSQTAASTGAGLPVSVTGMDAKQRPQVASGAKYAVGDDAPSALVDGVTVKAKDGCCVVM